MEKRLEVALDHFTADRFAGAHASLVAAQVVGIAGVLALGPICGQRVAAIGAADEAAQREVLAEIGARRNARAAFQALLDFLEGLEADQTFMASWAKRDVPRGHLDVARIERLGEKVFDPLVGDFAVAVLWVERVRFEEAFHFGLRAEAFARVAFQSFTHDGGDRLVCDEHFALARGAVIAIAHGRIVTPIAIKDAPAHPVLGLLAILLALMLRNAGEQIFDELAVATFSEFERRGFQISTRRIDRSSQFPMREHAARKAADVIDKHDMRILAMASEERQHRFHSRTIDEAAGQIVSEDFHHLIATHRRVLAASRRLGV